MKLAAFSILLAAMLAIPTGCQSSRSCCHRHACQQTCYSDDAGEYEYYEGVPDPAPAAEPGDSDDSIVVPGDVLSSGVRRRVGDSDGTSLGSSHQFDSSLPPIPTPEVDLDA